MRLAVGTAVAVASCAALAVLIEPAELGASLRAALRSPWPLAGALGAYVLAFWLRAIAWSWMLAAPGGARPPRAGSLFSVLHASLVLNHALPARAGEVARPALAVRLGVPLSAAVSTTLVARGFDMLALLGIAAAAHAGVVASMVGEQATAFAAIAAVGGLVVATSMAVPRLGRTALRTYLANAVGGIRRDRLVGAALLTVGSWLLEAGVVLAAASALGVGLTPAAAAGATAVAVLAQVLQVTPGGVGLYEVSMGAALVVAGVDREQAIVLAVLTHGLKFAYAFTFGVAFALPAAVLSLRGLREDGVRAASRLEVWAARAWNVLNEGQPFTPLFALGVVALVSGPRLTTAGFARDALVALLAILPLALVWWRFAFPLRLRALLWVALAGFALAFRFVDLTSLVVVLALYFSFTVVLWGTVYYHLRIGTRWTNFTRFWRLVVENPDSTSGNFLEQVPKVLLLVWGFQYAVVAGPEGASGVALFGVLIAAVAVLAHQWWFTWVPALPQPGHAAPVAPQRTSRRVIVIAIDGCRADRLEEARTPFLDRLRAEGTTYADVCTVYPARTVTAFASMLTGAGPEVHGMRSNFVPRLGVRCQSAFDVLRTHAMSGRLVGIAHLIDAFGEETVRTVTAVMDNADIDDALVARAQEVLEREDPELLVLQLLSVDQTGHSRGSYHDEYVAAIEATDARIEQFLDWCRARGYLEGATVLVTSDHGQGIGIGGHGHMSAPEINVPCVWWGEGVARGRLVRERRFLTEVASTVCHLLGVPAPARATGHPMLALEPDRERLETLFVIPAHNEASNLPTVLGAIARAMPDAGVLVVDDGSTDGTAEVAAAAGARVVRHERNRGLGAALRTAFAVARDIDAASVVYLDADLEYDPADAAALLAPIRAGTADYVLGVRASRAGGMTVSRRLANTAFSLALTVLCGRRILDGQTGMRAFSRRAVDVAEVIHDYNYAQVLTLDLLHKGMRLAQVPITYRRRQRGRSFVRAEYLWRVPVGMAREVLRG
ncbi:MAG: flippase-like domain-containing protein [Dehalococcoidia bacterium]|nr:flippase-like domain-containing protein [Dehalococcoidia bacterium]